MRKKLHLTKDFLELAFGLLPDSQGYRPSKPHVEIHITCIMVVICMWGLIP